MVKVELAESTEKRVIGQIRKLGGIVSLLDTLEYDVGWCDICNGETSMRLILNRKATVTPAWVLCIGHGQRCGIAW